MMTRIRYVQVAIITLSIAAVALACGLASPTLEAELEPSKTIELEVNPSNTVASAAQPSSTSTRINTLTPVPTSTPIPSTTPTIHVSSTPHPTVESGVLKSELFQGGQGGDPTVKTNCELVLPASLPSVKVSPGNKYANPHYLHVCIFGFPQNERLTIHLVSPDGIWEQSEDFVFEDYKIDGQSYGTRVFLASKPGNAKFIYGHPITTQGIDTIEIKLWWPSGLADGEWKISAEAKTIEVEATFQISYEEELITTAPDIPLNPFEKHECDTFIVDDVVVLWGSGFEPNRDVPLGIYHLDESGWYQLIDSKLIKASSNGKFEVHLGLDQSYPGGDYLVVAAGQARNATVSLTSPIGCFHIQPHTVEANPDSDEQDEWQACLGARPSRLHVDDQAKVSNTPPVPNNVRNKPGTQGTNVIGKIQPGELIKIKDGPECANGWVWWKIKSMETDLAGWTAEGDKDNYWLVPVP